MKDEFLELTDDFLDYLYQIRGYSDTTIITYEIALRQMIEVSHINELDGVITIDITPFRFQIIKNTKKTIAKKLSAIRSFTKYLNNQKNLNVKYFPNESIKVPSTLPKPIEQGYIQEILENANIEEKTIVYILYGLGLRISELANLKIEDIKNGWIIVHGKGGKVRQLPLLLELEKSIKEYLDIYKPTKYLFEKNKASLGSASLRYKLTKLFASHGIKATPHQLRHSFATHLLNSGARISDVSELLGHSTMATTQIYTKLGSTKKLQEYMKAHPLAKG
ncbi:MAG: tyrosine-type recombinase/integrase [Sulfurovaceae bacterium]|nr:tyrosine-type recombinase/integrase [Sulfurovaceae bacterium]MDD5548387.1 tyrosine-type recombinase/integrase [Sulfurovaceae bacterium]